MTLGRLMSAYTGVPLHRDMVFQSIRGSISSGNLVSSAVQLNHYADHLLKLKVCLG